MKNTLWEKDNFAISIDKYRLNTPYIHQFLSTSYWAENIPIETVRKSIEGSLCFGVYHGEKQIGFARVISDLATFAYLADVFIEEEYRGLGLGKRLMQVILSHPDLQGLRRFMLATRDAHGLYSQFGFVPLTKVDRWMQRHQENLYKKP
ncbi:MAG TPA: GNAT family N-acetyltransferase [Puia sp.]|nr:GNAT family N-acetyltransferase [Puia sp.]